ncbi:MAG: mechanosensitive ion channel family protein, partial [Candidatus Diapherotrites archaeon]|nr:mechanosensitive ion channel family protein [Candidatus Diapherotrites archaeon]
LNMLVIYWVIDLDKKFDIMSEVNFKIKEEFEKAKIEFAFPTQTVYLKK